MLLTMVLLPDLTDQRLDAVATACLHSSDPSSPPAMPPKAYPILAPPSPVIPTEINDDHDVLCVMDMLDTLDSIPGELTQRFGDLRELDAVLNGELGVTD